MKKLFLLALIFILGNCVHAEITKAKGHYVFDVLPSSLDELVQDSEYVLNGKVTKKEPITVKGLEAIKYTIQVNNWYKGKSRWAKNNDIKVFTYTQWTALENTTSSNIGDEILSGFAKPSKEYGLSSTTALQFDYKLLEDKSGNKKVKGKVAKRFNNKDFGSAFVIKNRNLKITDKTNVLLRKLSTEEKDTGNVSVATLEETINHLVSEQGDIGIKE